LCLSMCILSCIPALAFLLFIALSIFALFHTVSFTFGVYSCRTTPGHMDFLRAPLYRSLWNPEYRLFALFQSNGLGMPTELFGPTPPICEDTTFRYDTKVLNLASLPKPPAVISRHFFTNATIQLGRSSARAPGPTRAVLSL